MSDKSKLIGTAYDLKCSCLAVVTNIIPYVSMLDFVKSNVQVELTITEFCHKTHIPTTMDNKVLMFADDFVSATKPSYGDPYLKHNPTKTLTHKKEMGRDE